MAFTVNRIITPPVEVEIITSSPSIILPEIEIEVPEVKIEIRNHNEFLDEVGFRESSNNYKAVNQFGYLGKYQFGRKTLNAIGFKDISNYEFLSNPEIQEEAMLVLLQKNKHTLRREIKKYVGETVNGIYITESGILAAAHLGGAGNVRKFFRKGYEFEDGNGTKMTSYMIRFADYNLNLKQ
ncbi:peptidoglycan-binding protein LysM [Schleiferiaceae bacterium]|nr:peptidoglycan-binding protein LysM [Schleiferiaceae bacterium]